MHHLCTGNSCATNQKVKHKLASDVMPLRNVSGLWSVYWHSMVRLHVISYFPFPCGAREIVGLTFHAIGFISP